MTDISKCIQYLIIIAIIVGEINGANILAMFPSVWTSHYIFGREILVNLASRGHNVTVAYNGRQQLPKIMNDNYTEIIVSDDNIDYNDNNLQMSYKFNEIREKSTIELFTRMLYTGTSNVDMFLNNKNIQNLIESNMTFDLLIGDFFLSDSLFGFAHIFQCPTIIIGPTGMNQWLTDISGNPHNSAINPSCFLPYLENMSLLQRIINTLMSTFETLTYNFFHMMYHETFYQKYFSFIRTNNLPILKDLMENVSLILLNSNPILQHSNAFLPNIIEIGGAHINSDSKDDLSKDLSNFIEESTVPVILINFGATLKTCDLPKEKLESILAAVNQSYFRVILKWEHLILENKPQNVFIQEWLPQQKLLAHPKVKLLITSGGLLSYFEAIYYEKPILGIPIFPNQVVNVKRIEQLQCGLKLDYEELTTIKLMKSIQEILTNPQYTENVLKMSKIFKSTNMHKPLDVSAFYIEQILNTNGGLQNQQVYKFHKYLSFLQLEMIDVLAIILSGILIIIALPSIIICIILRKSNNNQLSNNNNMNFLKTLNGKKILKNKLFFDRKKCEVEKKDS